MIARWRKEGGAWVLRDLEGSALATTRLVPHASVPGKRCAVVQIGGAVHPCTRTSMREAKYEINRELSVEAPPKWSQATGRMRKLRSDAGIPRGKRGTAPGRDAPKLDPSAAIREALSAGAEWDESGLADELELNNMRGRRAIRVAITRMVDAGEVEADKHGWARTYRAMSKLSVAS